jgi:anti-anti-sigma factor
VEVGGHLDLTTAPSLDRALTQALTDALLVVLDLSQLVSVDSVGTDAIAAAEARAQQINRELLLAGELSEVAAA